MIMSTFELKFFTLAWNEAEAFITTLKHEVDCLLDLSIKVWKKNNLESSALFGLENAIVYF